MGRSRIIPDTVIFAAVRALLAEGGDKAVAFSAVARVTGLAAPSLVQRYGSRAGMVQAALTDAWDRMDAASARAAAATPSTAKGAAQFLKALSEDGAGAAEIAVLAADFRDADMRARAAAWRAGVETALAVRLGGGARGRDAGAMLFAAWQGQVLWDRAGGRGFRLKDAVKRLE